MMHDYGPFLSKLAGQGMSAWAERLPADIAQAFDFKRHGDLKKWQDILASLPAVKPSKVILNRPAPQFGFSEDLSDEERRHIERSFLALQPWRKGPFDLFGIHLDAEWRSDLKWQRLEKHIAPLQGRTVLDVGSGNGYYALRMAGAGASLVVGVDPTLLYVIQFQAFQKYLNLNHVEVLPVGIQDLPEEDLAFDTVFSMGLLYHSRDPRLHLKQLSGFLKERGELVLETLVLPGDYEKDTLAPKDRYAQMRNVWQIPKPRVLESWLSEIGFQNIRYLGSEKTTPAEQRVTRWMGFQSLSDFLDPDDSDLTMEGYPAPRRGIWICRKH